MCGQFGHTIFSKGDKAEPKAELIDREPIAPKEEPGFLSGRDTGDEDPEDDHAKGTNDLP